MKDLTGKKFGKLTAISVDSSKRTGNIWLCRCDCGRTALVLTSRLLNGHTRSCGCMKKESVQRMRDIQEQRGMLHHMTGTPTFNSWHSMMERCFSQKAIRWHQYGGIGIKPCSHIAESPKNLLSTIGERPTGTSLDRIDNKLGYTCGKCAECKSNSWAKNIRWATAVTQMRNSSRNRLLTIGGVQKCLTEWAEISGLKSITIHARIKSGWSENRWLSPIQQ